MSKVTQDLMGYQYFQSYGMPIIRTRAFNHAGPGQPPLYALASFARQVAAGLEAGEATVRVATGNPDARRDYTDVRDIVRGYWRLLEDGAPGEVYNLCSGKAWAIQDVLDFMLARSRVPNIEVREDPSRLRPSDVPVLIGDASRVEQAVGWRPEIPFEQTLEDLLEYWRRRVTEG